MARDPLERLVADARNLPLGPPLGAPLAPDVVDAQPFAPRGLDRRRPNPPARQLLPLLELRIRVRELLTELGRRLDESLPKTLAQAHGAWDQIDSLRLLDKAVHDEHRALERAARRMMLDESAELRALGTEVQLTLDAAIGLCSLVERRLATLVRLRLRATCADEDEDAFLDPETLLPDGRPFLDLAAALHETARRWT